MKMNVIKSRGHAGRRSLKRFVLSTNCLQPLEEQRNRRKTFPVKSCSSTHVVHTLFHFRPCCCFNVVALSQNVGACEGHAFRLDLRDPPEKRHSNSICSRPCDIKHNCDPEDGGCFQTGQTRSRQNQSSFQGRASV